MSSSGFYIIEPKRNNKTAFKSLKKLSAKTRRGIDKAFRVERVELKTDTVKGFKETKTGNLYRVYRSKQGRTLKRGRIHQASTPRQTPAILSGDLMRSLGFTLKRGRMLTYGANTPYAKRHEMSGRSYLAKSIKNRREAIGHNLSHEIEKELNSVKK